MIDFTIHKTDTANYISVYIFRENMLSFIGSAELSDMCFKNQFYFNRLFVKPEFRGNGFAHILMKEMLKIIDLRKIDIMLDINAYGDLNHKQLLKFYQKYNFKLNSDNSLTRKGITNV